MFRLVEMTEVYSVDVEGRIETGTVGFFKNPDIAAAFAKLEGGYMMHTRPTFVLTDGILGFVVRDHGVVKLFVDEEEAVKLREKALAKLSPEERKILGH